MTFLPIVELELRQGARRKRTYLARFGAALLAVCIGLGLLSPSFWGVISPTETGRALFQFISCLAAGYSLLIGIFATADCLSEEKRDGTLGLLILTKLGVHHIVIGKLVARSLNFFYGLLAVLPIMGVSLLLGGVTSGEFWRMNLVLVNTFFLSVTLGICTSSQSYDGRKAVGAVVFLLALITFGPWFFTGGLVSSARSFTGVYPLLFSPATAFWLVPDADYAKLPELYWTSIFIQNMVSWAFLFAAGSSLHASWNYEPQPGLASRWLKGLGNHDPASAAVRSLERAHWLALNPVLWLAQRERYVFRVYLPYCFVAAGIWVIGWFTLSHYWRKAEVILLTAAVAHTLLKYWIATEVTRRFSEARRNGLLELLLVTPVSVAEVLQGMLATIKQQFLLPVIVALIGDLGLLFLGMNASANIFGLNNLAPYLFASMTMLVCDAYTLCWVGLWKAMSVKNPRWAFLQTFAWVMIAPWFFMVGFTMLFAMCGGEVMGMGSLIVAWFTTGYLMDIALSLKALNRLSNDFREMIVSSSAGSS